MGGACQAFTLQLARQVLPDLPDQKMDLGDGNCTYADPPDASNTVNSVEFVRPYVDQPGWEAKAQAGASSRAQVTAVPVGDGGFCADQGGDVFELGWQRGSTGFELDVMGPAASCAGLTSVATTINASF